MYSAEPSDFGRLPTTPIDAWSGWHGIQTQPPERAVVPPDTGAFSATMTSSR